MSINEFYIRLKDKNRLAVKTINQGNNKVIIICPGFFQSKDTPTFQAIARSFSKNFDVMSVDMRGHGHSSGLCTFGVKEELDIAAVVNRARENYERVGIIAFSLSALVAVNYISANHDINSLALISCPMVFEKIEYQFWKPSAIKTGLGGLEKGAGVRPGNFFLKKRKPIKLIDKISPIPVLLIHGSKDSIVNVQHSKELYKAAKQPKKLVIFKEGGHAEELFRESRKQFKAVLDAWFRQTLI